MFSFFDFFTGKELDPETGLYYYGARYLDPKYSIWLSADPALGEYIPGAPVNEEAKKRNGNLPGMGGVFNTVNLHLYHYAGNNPVKYIDPDGRFPWLAGAAIGFAVSTASEIIPRMVSGQSLTEAVVSVVNDPVAIANIASSTVIGAVSCGVSAIATKSVTQVGTVAARNIAINTISGAVDASVKDVAGKALTGESQNLRETAIEAGKGAASALIFSSVTQGTIAGNTKRSSEIVNVLTKTEKNVKIIPPPWAGAAGITGETIIPAIYDTYKKISQQETNE